jgi:hypothetical protein
MADRRPKLNYADSENHLRLPTELCECWRCSAQPSRRPNPKRLTALGASSTLPFRHLRAVLAVAPLLQRFAIPTVAIAALDAHPGNSRPTPPPHARLPACTPRNLCERRAPPTEPLHTHAHTHEADLSRLLASFVCQCRASHAWIYANKTEHSLLDKAESMQLQLGVA